MAQLDKLVISINALLYHIQYRVHYYFKFNIIVARINVRQSRALYDKNTLRVRKRIGRRLYDKRIGGMLFRTVVNMRFRRRFYCDCALVYGKNTARYFQIVI